MLELELGVIGNLWYQKGHMEGLFILVLIAYAIAAVILGALESLAHKSSYVKMIGS